MVRDAWYGTSRGAPGIHIIILHTANRIKRAWTLGLCACRRQNQNLTSPWSRAHPKWVKPTGDVPWAGWRASPACAMQEPIPDWRRNYKSISRSYLNIIFYIICYHLKKMFKHYFSDTIFCGVNYKKTKKKSLFIYDFATFHLLV